MTRAILWALTLAVVLSAGVAMTFSPEPAKLQSFAQNAQAPEKP